MKWLVVIIILLAMIALIWLRTVRKVPPAHGSHGSHRLDDAISPPSTTTRPPLDPSVPAGGTLFSPEPPKDQPSPGADLAQEPERAATEEPDPRPDPLPPQGRPEV